MTIKNAMVFGTFDQAQTSAWPQQSSIFSQAVAQAASMLSGIPRDGISVKQAGAVRTKGNMGSVVKALLSVIGTGNAKADRMRGGLIGKAISGPLWKPTVDKILATATNLPSALTGLTSSLDQAIAQNPPGFTLPAPTPGTASLSFAPVLGDWGSFQAFQVKIATAALDPGQTLTQNLTLTPASESIYKFMQIDILGPGYLNDFTFRQLVGNWEISLADTVNGANYLTKAVQNPASTELLKNGAPDPNTESQSAGALVNGPNYLSVLTYIFPDYFMHGVGITELTNQDFAYFESQFLIDEIASANVASGAGIIKITNNGGSPLAVGTNVGDLFLASAIPLDV